MHKDFAEEKGTFLGYKKQNFQKSKNSHFSKGVNSCFRSEKRPEIILNAFAEKKQSFFDYNNKISKVPKIAFSKAVNPCFRKKKKQFFLFM